MHQPGVAKMLISDFGRAHQAGSKRTQLAILEALARLYHKEAPYDGSWWWNTRPDTHGPYYKAIAWEETPLIEQFLLETWSKGDTKLNSQLSALNAKHRLGIEALSKPPEFVQSEESEVDLKKIQNEAGEVGNASIEDVMLAVGKLIPNMEVGRYLFQRQGCAICHALTSEEAPKGPFMGQIGSIMKADQIAESILRPNASIAQGFASVLITLKDGQAHSGFVTQESASQLTLRYIVGGATQIPVAQIQSRSELEHSMMPAGLANALSLQEFTSLVRFLADQKQ